jgi:DNA replication protein DnaC
MSPYVPNSTRESPYARGNRFETATCANTLLGVSDQALVLQWMKNPKDFLVYLGCPGNGKTHFCHALMNDMKPTPQLLYRRHWNESQFISRVKAGFDMQGTFEQAVEALSDDHLVIMDDLGSTGTSEWKKDVLLKFIDVRYASRLPTVITSNLTKEEIWEKLGKRAHSRIFDIRNTLLSFGEVDFRKTGIP